MKMLVVDDDIQSLGTLCNMLRTYGYTVDMAPSAEIAIRLMAIKPYDVIFLDYNMPKHNGVWFMRNATILPNSTVILVTGFVDPTAMSDFRHLGIQIVIKKPLTLVTIQGCLKGVLNRPTAKRSPFGGEMRIA